MVDPVTPNKGFITPPNAADPGTWDIPVNSNAQTSDAVLGGLTVLNAQGASGVVALTQAQYRPANIVITGVPGGALTYQLPAGVGGFYFVANAATGANSTVAFGSASVAGTVAIPSGVGAAIVIDPVYGARRANSIAEEAAGPAGAVQYAGASGFFAGDLGLVYNPTTQSLTIGGSLGVTGNIQMLSGSGLYLGGMVVGGNAQTPVVAVPFAGSLSADATKSNVFSTTLSGNATLSITNIGDGQTINWRLQQDGAGNRTMSWPSNFRWPGGTAGVLSTSPNAVDLLVTTFFASTGTWLASLLKGFG